MWQVFDYLFETLFAWAARGFKAWRRRRLVMEAQTWSQAPGRGLEAHAESTNSHSHPIWTAEIVYSYVLDGEYYSGFASLPAEDEKHAKGLALG